jgi:hypothetical protein
MSKKFVLTSEQFARLLCDKLAAIQIAPIEVPVNVMELIIEECNVVIVAVPQADEKGYNA